MANKITLDTITSSFASTSLFNTNFAAIKSELDDKVLYRDNPTGEANQMLNDLDMNSNDILNASSVNADVIVLNGTQITPTGTTSLPASGLTYDNTTSGLIANNVQDALDEVDSDLDTAQADIDAIEVQQAQGQNYGKNLIINGDFSIWQRGTSQTSSGYGSVDRFKNFVAGSSQSISRQSHTLGLATNPTPASKYFFRNVVTSVAGAGNLVATEHYIEDVSRTAGREVTLSFWAKADSSKNIATQFQQNFGTGGGQSASVNELAVTTHALTTTWTKYTVTTTLPSISGKTLGTNGNDFLVLTIWLDAGSNFDSQTNSLGQQSGTFDIANVQLEFGDTATEFEYVSPADQLTRCKRYFERITGTDTDQITLGVGFALFSATAVATPFYYAEKRAIPAITLNGTLSAFDSSANAITLDTSFSYQDIAEKAARVVASRSTGTHTSGDVFLTRINTGLSNSIDVDAEL